MEKKQSLLLTGLSSCNRRFRLRRHPAGGRRAVRHRLGRSRRIARTSGEVPGRLGATGRRRSRRPPRLRGTSGRVAHR